MSLEPGIDAVIGFYDTHPINEFEILEKLRADGIELEGLAEEVLKDYDQDHFGGLEAVDVLAERAGITSATRVLDVCSGMGGPARYLASRFGCRVSGLDVTPSRHDSAIRLTRLVGLDHLVDFRLGNALDMPFADAAFDVVIGQEAFAQLPDKPRLIAECESTLMLQTGLEDDEVAPGTHVMFDCHGTLDLFCWDGAKTWVVEGEPRAARGGSPRRPRRSPMRCSTPCVPASG